MGAHQGRVRTQAKKAYDRNPCLAHRIIYVHTYLLSKLWYTAQLLPVTQTHIQQPSTAVNWYMWIGAIFRITTATLQRSRRKWGMALANIAAKCRALLLCCLYLQGKNERLVTSTWLRYWDLTV
jgi:hypothetical protein